MQFVTSRVTLVVVVLLTGCYLKQFDITLSKVPPPGSVIRVTGSVHASLCT
jgi:hypothetical protein